MNLGVSCFANNLCVQRPCTGAQAACMKDFTSMSILEKEMIQTCFMRTRSPKLPARAEGSLLHADSLPQAFYLSRRRLLQAR